MKIIRYKWIKNKSGFLSHIRRNITCSNIHFSFDRHICLYYGTKEIKIKSESLLNLLHLLNKYEGINHHWVHCSCCTEGIFYYPYNECDICGMTLDDVLS